MGSRLRDPKDAQADSKSLIFSDVIWITSDSGRLSTTLKVGTFGKPSGIRGALLMAASPIRP